MRVFLLPINSKIFLRLPMFRAWLFQSRRNVFGRRLFNETSFVCVVWFQIFSCLVFRQFSLSIPLLNVFDLFSLLKNIHTSFIAFSFFRLISCIFAFVFLFSYFWSHSLFSWFEFIITYLVKMLKFLLNWFLMVFFILLFPSSLDQLIFR